MESENTVCPVCTLYLRPGITLKSHLTSHPKQKVIDALVNLTCTARSDAKDVAIITNQSCGEEPNLPIQSSPNWTQPTTGFNPIPTNHAAFIYQQFMSTTSQPPPNASSVNPVGQQYITIPTVFNPQVMCQPYVYQQQQVIMSAGTTVPSLSPLLRKPQIIDVSNDVETSTTEIAPSNFEEEQVEEDMKHDSSKEEEEDEPENEIDSKIKFQKEEDVDIDIDEPNYSEYENVDSPTSSAESDYVQDRSELNKACQTLQSPQTETEDTNPQENGEDECFNENEVECEEDSNHAKEFDEPDYECNNLTVVQTNDQVIDMDGMQLILCNNFMGSQLISQVDDFDCLNNRPERAVLMNIGGIDGGSVIAVSDANVNIEQLAEESVSRESTNMSIRADERMPPRGELSGQESNGAASDIAWSRMQYESNSATSTSYDLLARETWEGSDCSDSEVPPLQSRVPLKGETYTEDSPTIINIIEAPLNFKCSSCGERFTCVKERRTHQIEVHADKEESDKSSPPKSNNIIGSKINKKGVKKLVIKPKTSNIKTENNFDNVFTNKIEVTLENNDRAEPEEMKVVVVPERDMDAKENVKLPLCRLCNLPFPDAFKLKLHRQDVHSKKSINRYKCDTCGENMANENKFNEHLKIHPLECRLCGKYFYRRQNIQLHMKRHLGIKPYMCDFCEKSFLTKQKLEEHKNTHTGEAPIKCTMCDETFRRHSNLVQHRNRHHLNIKKKIKDYICYCGEITHSKKKFAWHQETHDLKPKACTHCNEKFVHMASLTRHMRRAHNKLFVPSEERNNENVECPVCKGIYLRSSLEAHIRNHSGSRPFSCLICNKDFTTKWNLKLHKWTHAARASKPYKCDQCKGAFIRESDYIAHMNSHKSVRPYTCNYCGAQFIRKYNCQRHVKEHEIDKTYTCTICNKGFHRSYYLKDHMRVHSGIRPYSCHICGKTSTTKSNHNKHVMIHHAKEPVSTEN